MTGDGAPSTRAPNKGAPPGGRSSLAPGDADPPIRPATGDEQKEERHD